MSLIITQATSNRRLWSLEVREALQPLARWLKNFVGFSLMLAGESDAACRFG
jgi:hypothetical protein